LPAPHAQLFGREQHCATVRDLTLQAPGRLVTLTGTGGCGKTQLALLVATSLIDVFPNGVWLVDLAPVQAGSVAFGRHALFQPLRARVQTVVDHRFYRRKYDATRTLEQFASQIRDEVELHRLTAGLVTVVRKTMQPTHASLWLRSPVPSQPRPDRHP
jgi:ABC-type taurine transport system ATPase subunit